ncbi:hypothetical protein MRX96_038640 [Rhipicephalus microplus]
MTKKPRQPSAGSPAKISRKSFEVLVYFGAPLVQPKTTLRRRSRVKPSEGKPRLLLRWRRGYEESPTDRRPSSKRGAAAAEQRERAPLGHKYTFIECEVHTSCSPPRPGEKATVLGGPPFTRRGRATKGN